MTPSEPGQLPAPSPPRARSRRAHRAILTATEELLSEVGYSALTIEGVAARAGVGKATVYRWWPSKGALVIEALSERNATPPLRETGHLRNDLIDAVRQVIAVFTSSIEGSIIPAMTADLVRDPAMAEMFRDCILRPRRSVVAAMISRAVERGDLSRDVDIPLILDACAGTVFYRLAVSGEPLSDTLATELVDLVLTGAQGDRR